VERSIAACIDAIQAPLEQLFPKSQADARPDRTFENYPEIVAIVDASPIFIQKSSCGPYAGLKEDGQRFLINYDR
jgi:hypothetical protein